MASSRATASTSMLATTMSRKHKKKEAPPAQEKRFLNQAGPPLLACPAVSPCRQGRDPFFFYQMPMRGAPPSTWAEAVEWPAQHRLTRQPTMFLNFNNRPISLRPILNICKAQESYWQNFGPSRRYIFGLLYSALLATLKALPPQQESLNFYRRPPKPPPREPPENPPPRLLPPKLPPRLPPEKPPPLEPPEKPPLREPLLRLLPKLPPKPPEWLLPEGRPPNVPPPRGPLLPMPPNPLELPPLGREGPTPGRGPPGRGPPPYPGPRGPGGGGGGGWCQ